MPARSKGLVTILAALGLTLALVAPAAAQSAGSFEIIQVQPTATLSDHNTLVTIGITYRCTFPESGLSTDPEAYSGFGGVVTEIQKKRTVVSNVGAWAGLLECDGTPRTMTSFSIESGAGRWAQGAATLDFFVQFTDDISGAVFRLDVEDIAITIVAGKGNR